jgi:hypothetical protein
MSGIITLPSYNAEKNGNVSRDINIKYPISLSAAGVARALGTWTLILTGVGGASTCYYNLNWIEIK